MTVGRDLQVSAVVHVFVGSVGRCAHLVDKVQGRHFLEGSDGSKIHVLSKIQCIPQHT